MQDLGERDLLAACAAAGVQLGAYDRRVLRWLAGFEPASTSAVAGVIIRASGAAVINAATVRRALADAVAWRSRQIQACAECDGNPQLPRCDECAESLIWESAYAELLARARRRSTAARGPARAAAGR